MVVCIQTSSCFFEAFMREQARLRAMQILKLYPDLINQITLPPNQNRLPSGVLPNNSNNYNNNNNNNITPTSPYTNQGGVVRNNPSSQTTNQMVGDRVVVPNVDPLPEILHNQMNKNKDTTIRDELRLLKS